MFRKGTRGFVVGGRPGRSARWYLAKETGTKLAFWPLRRGEEFAIMMALPETGEFLNISQQ